MNSTLLLQITGAGRNFVEIMQLLKNDNIASELEQRLNDDDIDI